MKVLAFNCSPRMDKANTSLILQPFLEGIREAGGGVELFYTRKLEIKPCTGEFHFWTKHPGRCYQDDDMQMLYPKLQNADVWIFATPVYVDGVSGMMKNLVDRMISLVEPFFELSNGHCRHSLRKETKGGKIVLVSNCGFWEMDNFNPMLAHMKAICLNMRRDFAGALLRPHGSALKPMMKMGVPLDDVFEASREAGRQLVLKKQISPETQKKISRELLPLDMYIQRINNGFKQALDTLK